MGPTVGLRSGASAGLPVDPASPVLLTKNGPLATSPPAPSPAEAGKRTSAPLRSSRVGRERFRPRCPRSEALRDASGWPPYCGRRDPEGNFGENQLLDRSIGLSPLYPPPASDSHVSGGPGLHQSFPRLRPGRAKIAVFRVSAGALSPRSPPPKRGRAGGPELPRGGGWGLRKLSLSLRAGAWTTRALARPPNSSVRVTRRVNCNHFASGHESIKKNKFFCQNDLLCFSIKKKPRSRDSCVVTGKL
jgi:hypothetical protein